MKVCTVTGSRADWGLLHEPVRLIAADPDLTLQLVAGGAHLSRAHGETISEIEEDGFEITARVAFLDGDDSVLGVSRALSRAVAGFAECFQALRPDIVMVLGDRYEILAAAQAALLANIPIAHIAGGDITRGAFDDQIRDAISVMASLHFATNERSAERLRHMVGDPASVHVTGSPGIDRLKSAARLDRATFFAKIGLEPKGSNLLVTFHPETSSGRSAQKDLEALLGALSDLGDECGILLTGSNADPQGLALSAMAREFADARSNAVFIMSLGKELYASALCHVDAMVGNSSSGLYEAPTFGIPAVNIGTRQDGRLKAASVIDCSAERAQIADAVRRALAKDCASTVNPYGDGTASEKIVSVLKDYASAERAVAARA